MLEAYNRITLTVTTDANGAATVYFPPDGEGKITGLVHSIRLVDVDLTNDCDVSFTSENTGEVILTDTAKGGTTQTWYPRPLASVALTGVASAITEVPVALVVDRIKLVIANDTSGSHSGVFHIIIVPN